MNLFLELLKVSLGTRDKLSRVLNAREWEALYEEAGRQAIVGLLLSGLERLPEEQLPPLELKLQWIGEAQIIEQTSLHHQNRAGELTARFRAVGFHSCILKGLSAANRYANPLRRDNGDIDFWTNGRRKDVMLWLREQCPLGNMLWHHADAQFFDDVKTEIHFHPSWLYDPVHNYRLQRWFNQQSTVQMQQTATEKGYVCTTASFDAVYQLAHILHHLMDEGVGLRHVIDYYYVIDELKETDAAVKEEALRVIKRVGLWRLFGGMMWMLHHVCGMSLDNLLCEPDDKEGRYLLKEVMQGGNFGHYREDGQRRNSIARMWALLPHYPREVLWIVPWKIWHRTWMVFNR